MRGLFEFNDRLEKAAGAFVTMFPAGCKRMSVSHLGRLSNGEMNQIVDSVVIKPNSQVIVFL